MKNKLIYIVSLMACFTACQEYDPEVSTSNSSPVFSASEILDMNGYTIYNDAVAHAGISEELYSGDSGIFFIPTNEAFAALFDELNVSNVTEIDASIVANVIRYHASDILPSSTLEVLSIGILPTFLPNKSLYLSQDLVAVNIALNGKAIIRGGALHSLDGVVYEISAIVDIPATHIMDILSKSEDHSSLVTELQRTGLDDRLSSATYISTFLAPNNDALTKADIASMDVADATKLLSFHLFPGRIYSTGFRDGRLASILGTQKNQNQQEVNVKELEFNGVELDSVNYSADNGVVHFLSGVMEFESTNSDFIPDDFQALIDEIGVEDAYNDIDTIYSIMVLRSSDGTPIAPAVGSFANDAEIQEWLDLYTMEGSIDIEDLSSGTKIETRGGFFYTQHNATTRAADKKFTVNSQAVLSTTLSEGTYNGYVNIFTSGAYPTPLPESTISEVLEEKSDYQLIAKAIGVTNKTKQVDSEGTTFYALHDTTFANIYNIDNVADLDELDSDDEDDAKVIQKLVDMIDAHTVPGRVESFFLLEEDTPVQPTADDDIQLTWGRIDSTLGIITDIQDPQNNFVNINANDFWASNGIIHVVGSNLD